jgi:hypothetical protein
MSNSRHSGLHEEWRPEGIGASKRCVRPFGLVALVALVATPGCQKREAEPAPAQQTAAVMSAQPSARPSATAARAEEPKATPTLDKKMQDHFTWAGAMKAAVIAGKLEGVTGPAKKLVTSDFGKDLPADWQAQLGPMKAAAKLAAEANDIQGASLAFGHVGAACGACHAKLGGPQLELGKPPGEASGAQAHMQRHVWAADRMWEGLMAPSDDAWKAGSEALIQAPLSKEELAGDQSVPDEIAKLAKSVHELGPKGRELTDPSARADLYGEFLATCADCHGTLEAAVK